MGFASGFRAGNALVDSVLAEQRSRKLDARSEEEFGWKRGDRQREEGFRSEEDAIRAEIRARDAAEAQPRAGLPVPATAAGPAVPTPGMAPGASEGIATNAMGAPASAVPVSVGQAAAATAGTATAPTPIQQATPAAGSAEGPRLGNTVLAARDARRLASVRGTPEQIMAAHAAERTAGFQNIIDTSVKKFMDLPEEERRKIVQSPNLTGDVPMVTLSTDKNGMMVIPVDPKTGELLNPNKPIKLSWADAAQLYASEQAAKGGFGAEAIDTATKVNSRIGQVIKDHNALYADVAKTSNDATYKGGTMAEQKRHNQVIEANDSAKTKLLKDKALAENNDVIAVGAEGITMVDKKSHKITTQPWPEGTSDTQKTAYIKKYQPTQETLKENPSGTVQMGNRLFQPNPNFNNPKADPTKANTTDPYIEVTPGKGGDIAAKLEAYRKSQGTKEGGAPAKDGAPAAKPGAPAAGLTVPPAAAAPRPPLTQNEQAIEDSVARQRAYDAEQQRLAGMEAVRRSGLYEPPTFGD